MRIFWRKRKKKQQHWNVKTSHIRSLLQSNHLRELNSMGETVSGEGKTNENLSVKSQKILDHC